MAVYNHSLRQCTVSQGWMSTHSWWRSGGCCTSVRSRAAQHQRPSLRMLATRSGSALSWHSLPTVSVERWQRC
jgi:hypothetical protein